MIIIMLSIVGTSYDGHCPSSCLFHLANKHHTHTHTHTHSHTIRSPRQDLDMHESTVRSVAARFGCGAGVDMQLDMTAY